MQGCHATAAPLRRQIRFPICRQTQTKPNRTGMLPSPPTTRLANPSESTGSQPEASHRERRGGACTQPRCQGVCVSMQTPDTAVRRHITSLPALPSGTHSKRSPKNSGSPGVMSKREHEDAWPHRRQLCRWQPLGAGSIIIEISWSRSLKQQAETSGLPARWGSSAGAAPSAGFCCLMIWPSPRLKPAAPQWSALALLPLSGMSPDSLIPGSNFAAPL